MHALGPYLDGLRDGEPLFPGITPARALEVLRLMMAGIGVANAGQYRTHDLRRGHALDLQLSGLFTCMGRVSRVSAGVCRGATLRDTCSWRMALSSLLCATEILAAGLLALGDGRSCPSARRRV